MGANNSASRTENLLSQYVNSIPNNNGAPMSGQQAYNYYRQKNEFTDISLFNDPQFERKINGLNLNESQANRLWFLANKVNLKAQQQFGTK